MGYHGGDSFPFNFEPNGIPFGSKSKGKLSPRSYPIQFERKRKYSFFSVSKSTITADCDSNEQSPALIYGKDLIGNLKLNI